MKTLPGRIAIDAAVCGGRHCFRGTRIPVYVVFEMLRNRESETAILESYPDLAHGDLQAALEYARNIAAIPCQSLATAG
ncbi:MAG: hypothetical protein BWK77_00220 [Verrucomicrobia bacterium A1]|nr:MAG: hypothetical protein BWK77_00220 [Verrucomicrobia bacterium A1]